jgi:hypothetical protein
VEQGWIFVPPASYTPVHDADGNLIEDARWFYTWDGENRLIAMEEMDNFADTQLTMPIVAAF